MRNILTISFIIILLLTSIFDYHNSHAQDNLMPTPTPDMGLPAAKERDKNIKADDSSVTQNSIVASSVQGVPEYLQVPFTKTGGVDTRNQYSGDVTVTVSGVGQSAGTSLNDAFYLFFDQQGNDITPPQPVSPFELYIDNAPAVDVIGARPPYQPDHVYVFTINVGPNPRTLNFGIGDTFVVDNDGSFTIGLSDTGTSSLIDSDGDAIWDHWESMGGGIDGDGDGFIDLDLYALGARPDQKDIFLEIDWTTGSNNEDHEPLPEAISLIQNAFTPRGITLHIDLSNSIPETDQLRTVDFCGTPNSDCNPGVTSFNSIKQNFFGNSTDSQARKDAKALIYHYALFVREVPGVTGRGEQPGNDMIIGLSCGYTDGICRDTLNNRVSRSRMQAGVLMHELGHNLGLGHGGGDIYGFKPNYFSVMNYYFTANGIPSSDAQSFTFDYSDRELASLDEYQLNESDGVGETRYATYYTCDTPNPGNPINNVRGPVRGDGTINWNCFVDPIPVIEANINRFVNHTFNPPLVEYDDTDIGDPYKEIDGLVLLKGHDDWGNLVFNFRNSWDGISDFHLTAFNISEIDLETLISLANPTMELADIQVASFQLELQGKDVKLLWETSLEKNIVGFNLYRATDQSGPYSKINQSLIPGNGDTQSGSSYNYLDTPGNDTFFYMLESVGTNGVTTQHGPVQIQIASPDVVNRLLSLDKVKKSYNRNPADNAPAGIFSVALTFSNTSAARLRNLSLKIYLLTGRNLVLNADGGAKGKGATVTIPDAALGADGILEPGESFTAVLDIGLARRRRFILGFNVFGVIMDDVDRSSGQRSSRNFELDILEAGLQDIQNNSLYLPYLSK